MLATTGALLVGPWCALGGPRSHLARSGPRLIRHADDKSRGVAIPRWA
jgi:hypothetical protein